MKGLLYAIGIRCFYSWYIISYIMLLGIDYSLKKLHLIVFVLQVEVESSYIGISRNFMVI